MAASAIGVPPAVPNRRPAAPARTGPGMNRHSPTAAAGMKTIGPTHPSPSPQSRTSSALGSDPLAVMATNRPTTVVAKTASRSRARSTPAESTELVRLGLGQLAAEAAAALALVLAGHQREVGGREQVGGLHVRSQLGGAPRQRLRIAARADARRDDAGGDALGDLLRDVLLDAGQKHGELVAAPAVARVVVADGGPHRGRGRAQQLVAAEVAEGVVDLLEVVEVGNDHAERLRLEPRLVDRAVEPLVESSPVAERGQRIDARLALRLLL